MTFIQAIILGIVEGITEFLPISSTGHLILATELLKLQQTEFVKTFVIVIQFGAILSVAVLYFNYLLKNVALVPKILASFVPTAVVGFGLYSIIKNIFFNSESLVLWSLLIGGVALIVFEVWHKRQFNRQDELNQITYKQALIIGTFQSISVIPGVSRAAATIVGGLTLGLSRRVIVEYSFLLAIPTMLAASGFDLFKSSSSFSSQDFGVLAVGFITAFVVALLAIKIFLKFIQKNDFKPFGVYRILVAILFWLLIF